MGTHTLLIATFEPGMDTVETGTDVNYKFMSCLIEDPSIEDRLNFVRKSAGLDIKNSFYVLSPSSPQEISEFAIK